MLLGSAYLFSGSHLLQDSHVLLMCSSFEPPHLGLFRPLPTGTSGGGPEPQSQAPADAGEAQSHRVRGREPSERGRSAS